MSHDDILKVLLDKISDATEETRMDVRAIKLDVNNIKLKQVEQQIILDTHVRRTNLAEERLTIQEDKLDTSVQALKSEMAPFNSHLAIWSTLGKVLSILFGAVSAVAAIYKIFYH